jgi:hypothetical protein
MCFGLLGDVLIGTIRSAIGANIWWVFMVAHVVQIVVASIAAAAPRLDAGIAAFYTLDFKELEEHWSHAVGVIIGLGTACTGLYLVTARVNRSGAMIFTLYFQTTTTHNSVTNCILLARACMRVRPQGDAPTCRWKATTSHSGESDC